MLYAGIEAGGTKFVIGICDDAYQIIDECTIPTTSPEATMNKVIEYLKRYDIVSIGLACFGPIDLNRNSDSYGFITTTPKPGWSNYNIVGRLKDAFQVPIGFDTDVNAACLAEAVLSLQPLSDVVYITVGTGVGAGVMVNQQLIHGLVHPEVGHITLHRHKDDTNFESACPFHSDCLEGLSSGTAMRKRWQVDPQTLAVDHQAWDIEAYYLGQAIANIMLMYSPRRVYIGGGVMGQKQLLPRIHKYTKQFLNGYIANDNFNQNIEQFILLPQLSPYSGLLGAVELGKIEMSKNNTPF